MEMLVFRLPGHGDTTLNHMNSLRSHQHFCDVTIVASDNQTFRGHKVVLAACSPFLRDQFLLNPSAKLQVSMLHSSTVVCDLLQSCYTGVLQFNPEEIVNYLTAASYLQMEHIVERCRGALKKYMQPRTPNLPRVKTEESQSRPPIVSGSAPSVGPPPSIQPHSPALCSQDVEDNTDKQSLLDETAIKVNGSDEEEQSSRQEEYGVYTVYLPEEEEQQRADQRRDPGGDRGGPCYSETDGVLVGGGGGGGGAECGLNPSEHDINSGSLSRGGFTMEGLRGFRRRTSEPKVGRARGRGRGFKRWKWVASQERRPPGVAHHQDMWHLATSGIGGGFGLDYSQEGLKTGNYLSVDLPQMGDFGMGEAQGEEVTPLAANSMGQYPLGESNSAGEGSSGLGAPVPADEGGDESVAVVGSTSSASGPVICEHCGMTFPSASSLAIHSRATHMLYSCPCCGKHFHHSVNLTRHMAVHRGAGKSHQCPLCYKTFTQKSTLIDHMNLHSGERPHHCAYCHARFAHKPALRRHLKEQHGKTTGQNSLHEQEEREREQVAERMREEEQECLVTEQTS